MSFDVVGIGKQRFKSLGPLAFIIGLALCTCMSWRFEPLIPALLVVLAAITGTYLWLGRRR